MRSVCGATVRVSLGLALTGVVSSSSALPPEVPPGKEQRTETLCFVGDDGRLSRGEVTYFTTPEAAAAGRGAAGPDNRVDVVIVGDGYTASEMGLFHAHADEIEASLFWTEPLITYRNFFRVTRVEVVSNESGVDNDPVQGIERDTAMDMGFFCGGTERLLCVDVGLARGFALAGGTDADQVLAIANSTKYGGAGFPSDDVLTASGDTSAVNQLVVHELGHSLANLADEYEYDGPEVFSGPEPTAANTSRLDASDQVAQRRKWWRWMGADVPPLDGPTDTYEGGNYSSFGVYRPSPDSLMRSLGPPFNAPSVESLLTNIYFEVDPIDGLSHTAGPLPGNAVLEVTPMALIGRSMAVSWSVNGQARPDLVGVVLNVASLGLSSGDSVTVTVADRTPWVRNPGVLNSLLTQRVTWTISDAACGPADVALPLGVLDVNDIVEFVNAFVLGGPLSDVDPPGGNGAYNTGDLVAFVNAFNAGCP